MCLTTLEENPASRAPFPYTARPAGGRSAEDYSWFCNALVGTNPSTPPWALICVSEPLFSMTVTMVPGSSTVMTLVDESGWLSTTVRFRIVVMEGETAIGEIVPWVDGRATGGSAAAAPIIPTLTSSAASAIRFCINALFRMCLSNAGRRRRVPEFEIAGLEGNAIPQENTTGTTP